jgi:hypothetical protein
MDGVSERNVRQSRRSCASHSVCAGRGTCWADSNGMTSHPIVDDVVTRYLAMVDSELPGRIKPSTWKVRWLSVTFIRTPATSTSWR